MYFLHAKKHVSFYYTGLSVIATNQFVANFCPMLQALIFIHDNFKCHTNFDE